MLVSFGKAVASSPYNLNGATVLRGGNIPSGDTRVTRVADQLIGTQKAYNYVTVAAGSGLYGKALSGGTMAADDRDDCIIYYGPKRDLAGVATTEITQNVAGPFKQPYQITGNYATVYVSGFDYYSGKPINNAVSTVNENYGSTDDANAQIEFTIFTGGKTPINVHR